MITRAILGHAGAVAAGEAGLTPPPVIGYARRMASSTLLAISSSVLLLATGCATTPKPAAKVAPLDTHARATLPELILVSAVFGSGTRFADVTPQVINLLNQPDATFRANHRSLKVDPAPGSNKSLVIIYEFRGRRHQFVTGKDGEVSLDQLQRHAETARAESQPAIPPTPLMTPEPPSTAPLRRLAVLKDEPVGQPYVTVAGFCENPGHIVWDEQLRLAEVEAAAKFYQPPSVAFVVVKIHRQPQKRWIFEDMRIGRGRVVEPHRPSPRLLPGDRVDAGEMFF